MANGKDEPIQFTRGDAERLTNVEASVKVTRKLIWLVLAVGIANIVAQLTPGF